jgi:AcrR family transcriptional regulator
MSTPEAPGAAAARKRGRPPNPEAVARRKRELIVAAYAVFSARGYTAAVVADIAEQLEIGHGTFYRYFQSKRDVLDHVVDYGVERVVDAIGREARPDSAMSLDELMRQLRDNAERLFGLLDAEPGLARVILLEATVVDREPRARDARGLRPPGPERRRRRPRHRRAAPAERAGHPARGRGPPRPPGAVGGADRLHPRGHRAALSCARLDDGQPYSR